MMNRKKEKESLKQREQRNGYEEDVKDLNDFRAAFVFQNHHSHFWIERNNLKKIRKTKYKENESLSS